MRTILTIWLTCSVTWGWSQTLGGNAVYNFLKLPATPLLTATGGVNVSYRTNEVGLAANNPSLLSKELHSQVSFDFNSFLAGIKTYSLTGAYWSGKLNTAFGSQLYFVNYGSLQQTDAAGNNMGTFQPVDFVFQVSASRSYLERWNYGATLKFISSNYQLYTSSALALDVGVHYRDTAHLVEAALLARNMGMQLKTYAGTAEDLPFDFQMGITKKLAHAPFAFSLTGQQLHHFDIYYRDTSFNNENDFSTSHGFLPKLMIHFVVATHIYLGNNLEATLGYNHLRRNELNIGSSGNGLNGFSMGLRLKFQKLQVLYARSNYQRNISYNQLGLNLNMDRVFGWGNL